MKKILILAYDFPPYVSVGGLRPYNWYKYMPEFDVYPIIVTRQWNNKHGSHLDYIAPSESAEIITEKTSKGTIIRTPYVPNLANRLMLKYGSSKFKFLRKLISGYYEFSQFLFISGPRASLYTAAKEYLKNNNVDVIIATGDPFILFSYASRLSKIYNTPWIADYRDLWSQDLGIQRSFFLKNWNSYFEKRIVQTSALITTVSGFLKNKISTLTINKEFSILPNGYDPEVLESIKHINQQSEVFSIAIVGTIYGWHPLRSFLSVISLFIKNKKETMLKISFYGINIADELNELLLTEFADLANNVVIYPKIPNNLLLRELAKENIMLLFNNYHYMGTKIYEYIGMKRTILLCYTNDEEANKLKLKYYDMEIEEEGMHLQEELINETNSGYVIQDAKHLYRILEQLEDEFNKTGSIQSNTINSENYSRKHQVKQLAEIVKRISSPKTKNL